MPANWTSSEPPSVGCFRGVYEDLRTALFPEAIDADLGEPDRAASYGDGADEDLQRAFVKVNAEWLSADSL